MLRPPGPRRAEKRPRAGPGAPGPPVERLRATHSRAAAAPADRPARVNPPALDRVGDIFGHGKSAEDDPNATLAERINAHNLRARWTHTIGLGIGVKTPIGGTISIDYGWLVNPPDFLIPQANGNPAIFRPHRGQINFRFTQAF